MKKTYTFQVTLQEGNDEFWESLRGRSGADEVLTEIKAALDERGFHDCHVRLVGFEVDAAVSGADPVDQRAGFAEMLQHLAVNGAKTIIVESPDPFARDLAVQLAGHDMGG